MRKKVKERNERNELKEELFLRKMYFFFLTANSRGDYNRTHSAQ